jgi:hypothetical protein
MTGSLDRSPRTLAAARPALRPSLLPPAPPSPARPLAVDVVAFGGPGLALVALAVGAVLLLTGAEGGSDIPAGIAAIAAALGSIAATLVAMRSQLRREREGAQAAAYAALQTVIGHLEARVRVLGDEATAARTETREAREELDAARAETHAIRDELERTRDGLARAEATLARYGRAVAELQEHERQRIDAAVASSTPSEGIDARRALVSLDDSSPGDRKR